MDTVKEFVYNQHMKKKQICIATNNQHKVEEIKCILGGYADFYTLGELGIQVDIPETGTTLEENAMLKAQGIHALTDMAVLADDTGLVVPIIGGEPGVYSARYAGDGHNDQDNRTKLLRKLLPYPQPDMRRAYFQTALAFIDTDGTIQTCSGRVDGWIAHEESGAHGFGYDSIFVSDDLGCTFASASSEDKNRVSHRGRALHALRKQWEQK